MAGEIEDLSISFQADSIHSGSVSFGRFESEPLSWERRSSFSHNRYLEEVERCSKPGSVNEKKALLEAHFKKILLQQQESTEQQPSIEQDKGPCETSQNQNDQEEFKHQDEYDDSGHFDESPCSSDYSGEIEVIHTEIDSHAFSSFRSDENLVQNGKVIIEDSFHQEFRTEELHFTENACDVTSGSASGLMEKTQSLEGDHNEIESTVDSFIQSADCNNAEIIDGDNSRPQHPSHKSAPKVNVDPYQPISKPQHLVTNSQSNKLNKKAEAPESKTSRMIRGTTNGTNIKVRPSTTNSCNEASKMKGMAISGQDTENLKAKPVSANGRLKDKKKKVAESQQLSPKMLHSSDLSKRRVKATASSTKSEMKNSTGGFSFKCEERAERRKEFNMKLEKKLHAKENEISQIEAKKQERTEAEIKQFRKSLNFKATPMPSFYHTTKQRSSDGIKASSSKAKSPIKAAMKSPSPHRETRSRELSSSKAGGSHVSVGKSNIAISITSDLNVSSPGPSVEQTTPSAEASSAYEPARMAETAEKKGKDMQREKERSNSTTVKKDVRSVRMSRTRNIAVGVAS